MIRLTDPERPAPVPESERFAAYVAHELRTPLATQRALLEFALADPAVDTATWREVGEDILQACRQQERVLDACLALARGRVGLQRSEAINLGPIVASVVEGHDLHKLTAKLTLERAPMVGNRDLLECMITNLFTNAVRHNCAGGWIRLTTREADDRAVLTIENTGPPVPAKEIVRLFEPFQQLGKRPVAPTTGLGLGLAIVKAVAEAHRADITARSRPGGGLHIEIGFPSNPHRDRTNATGRRMGQPVVRRR
jgi:signal transduction histidine kinase